MNGFISLLATYYLCAGALDQGPLPHDQELRCAAAATTIGAAFLTEDERRAISEIGLSQGAMMHAGLLRFQAWEAEHADIVEAFEKAARTVVLTLQ
ncbi:hypothetical protein [Mangrovicoccus ximenensis]|uniref:hypothetical protein n=1 Tax=Mangrovicoccus ximenensis TaxID=1911570 RepID=UPI000D37C4C4|nr:hypothetical protein [Mangrovicoccus ximenensis]